MSDIERAMRLRTALIAMVTRYGTSQEMAVFALKNGLDDVCEKEKRAARRQFAAIQRLADALERLVIGGAS